MNLQQVTKIITELEARYKEDEAATRDAEAKASSLRTHLNHNKKILDTWKAHAAALKEAGEFH